MQYINIYILLHYIILVKCVLKVPKAHILIGAYNAFTISVTHLLAANAIHPLFSYIKWIFIYVVEEEKM